LTLLYSSPTPVRLPSGIELNYVRGGRDAGSAQTVIFIHGAMGDWRAFRPQWDVFTQQFDCISYSRRYSHPNPNPMETRQHNALVDAEDLEGLMDALGIKQAILVGSSYGGFTALAMALRAPERVRAVVAVEAPMMRYALQSREGEQIARDFLATSAEPARAAFERGDDAAGVALLTGGIVGPMLDAEKLAGLAMPVMLVSGVETAPVHDAIFKAVAAAMPQAQAFKVPGAGHSVSQQVPEVFNELVLDFLKSSLTEAA